MEPTISTDDVVRSLARFRASDIAMHQRVRTHARLGENELRILQFLLLQRRDGFDVKPSEISRHLGITSASTTALLDRLERQGSVERLTHPTDRRSILISATDKGAAEVADLVDSFEQRIAGAIDDMDESDRKAVIAFLDAVTDAADIVAPDGQRSRSLA